MTYIPHNYWMVCERTGIKFRRSEMREEPTGIDTKKTRWVHQSVWEGVHPQEYVKVPPEDPSVYPVRSDAAQVAGETTLVANFYKYESSIIITDGSGLSANDAIGIVADDNTMFWTFITSITDTNSPLMDVNYDPIKDANGEFIYTADANGYTVVLNDRLHFKSSRGNTVSLPSLNNESWV